MGVLFDVREEMSARSAPFWRVCATTPQQHQHPKTVQSGFEWFEFFGLLRLFCAPFECTDVHGYVDG